MTDHSGLKFIGFVFASMTFAVMMTAGVMVKGYSDGSYSLEPASGFARHTAQQDYALPLRESRASLPMVSKPTAVGHEQPAALDAKRAGLEVRLLAI